MSEALKTKASARARGHFKEQFFPLRIKRWIGAILLLIWAANGSAQITIFNINNGDVTALKSAITTGNTDSHTDFINLASNGTYTLSTVDNATDGGNGLPVIKAEANRSVIINGNGATIQRSTAGGTPNFRILEITSGAVVSINNLTISEGYVVMPAGLAGGGGGIFNSSGSLTLSACTFTVNGAVGGVGADAQFINEDGEPGGNGYGGAVYSSGGSVSATGCIFDANLAIGGNGGAGYPEFNDYGGEGGEGDGGGIGGFGSLMLTNCIFTNNYGIGGAAGAGAGEMTGGPADGDGGGVYNGGNMTVTGCTFAVNSASYGGGLKNEVAAAVTLSLCAFTQNSGIWGGGGIENEGTLTLARSTLTGNSISPPNDGGGLYNLGPATLSDCTFAGNSASDGGAIIHVYSTMAVTGCTFVSNSAIGGANVSIAGGGAINNQDALTVTNCTFCLNTSATDGGAVCNGQPVSDGDSATLGLINSTFSGNTATGQGGGIFFSSYGPTSHGTLANSIFKTGNHGANLANGGAGIITSQGHNISDDPGGGFLSGTGDMINTNPLLVTATPTDNGGPTPTISLFFTSPAIDHAGPGAPYRDQRGYFRNGPGDIGALEYSGGLVGKCSIARSGSDIVVSTEVIGGHSYRLRRRLALAGSSWQDIPGVQDLVATGNDIESIIDPGAVSLGKAFYRLDFEN